VGAGYKREVDTRKDGLDELSPYIRKTKKIVLEGKEV